MSGEQCCCFCLNLRTGSYLSGGYSIALGILSLIPFIFAGASVPGSAAVGIAAWIAVALFVLWIIFAILLIVGVSKSSRGYLIPWIVITIIICVFEAIYIIISLVNAKQTFDNSKTIAPFVFAVVIFILNIYALWCVISLHKRNMNP